MRLFYSLTDLEVLLAEESKRRIGYDPQAEAVVKATYAEIISNDTDFSNESCIIIELALPEGVGLVEQQDVKSIKDAGTLRGSKKRGRRAGKK